MTRVVLTLLVRDEADVVSAMIEHHLAAGVAHIVATDNGSTDATTDILAAYRDAGVLQLIHEPEHTYEQARWVTRMARLARTKHGADWVINADADEFWWPREAGLDLVRALEVLPAAYGTVSAPRENLVADPRHTGGWVDRLVIRDLLSLSERGTRIGNKTCHRGDPDVQIVGGNHAVEGPAIGPGWPGSPLTVLHVPDRSYEQFAHKIELGGSSLAANPGLAAEFGWHWRADYQRLVAGTLAGAWRGRQPSQATIERGLAEGRFVFDDRVTRRVYALRDQAVLPDVLARTWAG